MRIAITGASGFLGTAIADRLRRDGHDITRLVRSRDAARQPGARSWDPAAGTMELEGVAGHDAIVNLAGESIFALWTPARKRRIRSSRVGGASLIVETLRAVPEPERPALLLNASAAGYYGPRPHDHPVTEDEPPGDTFLAHVVRDWEAAAMAATELGVRVVTLRMAPVLDRDSVLIRGLATATRLGLGATLGDGKQPFPWVTRDDVADIAAFVVRSPDLHGPVNVAAPDAVTNREFTDLLARVLNRPRLLRVPAFAMKLAGDFGRELLGGARLVPAKLEQAGYEWRDPTLDPALRTMMDAS